MSGEELQSARFGRRSALTLAGLSGSWLALGSATLGLSVEGGANAVTLLGSQARRNVGVRDFGADGLGRGDDTSAFQKACDSLAGGGIIAVPRGIYRLSTVFVRNRGVSIRCEEGARLIKAGRGGVEQRGMFMIDGLPRARFEIQGAIFDLNGEGPLGIGRKGLIPNDYGEQTVAGITAIAGPANAAVFARRSSEIIIAGSTIENSGESGLLFRNCGQVVVRDCRFRNLANFGVEFSFTQPGADGGSGPIPACDDVLVEKCEFEDLDDYGLGSGNGVGVGGGGDAGYTTFRRYTVRNCRFMRCQRDIHFEFDRSAIVGITINGIRSREARQASIGLVSVRNASLSDIRIVDPGAAPSALLSSARPEICGIVFSSGFAQMLLEDVTITDTRAVPMRQGYAARTHAGSTRLVVPGGNFSEADTGRWIGIAGANPEGCAYVGKVAHIVSSSEAELSQPVATARARAHWAIGGATRNGIVLTAGRDIIFSRVDMTAGTVSSDADRQDAGALRVYGLSGVISFSNSRFFSARNGAEPPAAVRVARNSATFRGLEELDISGFARALEIR